MYVVESHKFAFLAMPGTGSVTVSRAIMRIGGRCLNGHHDTPEGHEAELREIGYDHTWTTATAVRQPVSWFRCMFSKGVCGAGKLERVTLRWIKEFERDPAYFKWGANTRSLFWKYTPFANVIWHQERLDQDIKAFPFLGQLEKWNVGKRQSVDWDNDALCYVTEKYRPYP